MKYVPSFSPTFTPGASGVGTLDFSGFSGFALKNLFAVVNETRGAVIYAPAMGPAFGYSAFGSGIITLQVATTGHNSGDVLKVIYDDAGAGNTSLASIATTNALQTQQLASLTSAATVAFQTSQLASLQSMDGKLPALIGSRVPMVGKNGTTALADSCVALTNFGVVGSLASGDLLIADGNAVGSNYVVLSLDPLSANTESRVEYNATFAMPYRASLGLSMSQRVLGQEVSVEFVDTGSLVAAFSSKAISSVSQSTTTLTVTTSASHGLTVGQAITIDGCSDSRINYPALVVASIPAANQFTATAGPGGTIASLTIGPFTSGTVYARTRLGRSQDGTSLIFENATATNASVYLRSDAGDALPCSSNANFIANHSNTIQSSVSVQAVNAQGVYAFQPLTKFELIADTDGIQWLNKTADGVAVQAQITKREQVVPNPANTYKLRFRANNNAGLTRPVAQITVASKAGSTTATVTTAAAHGLTTGDLINIYGSRDTTNFANLTTATAVASVIDANNFTVVWGASVTASSYAGYVSRVNGGTTQQGASTIVAQSISRTSNVVSVVGSATWTGAMIGDYINLIGIRDTSTGASLGLDGTYRVNNMNTTTLTLEPIGSAPTGADVGSVNCGGSFIKRTDLRIHFIRVFAYDRFVTEIIGSNSRAAADIAQAIPVAIANTPNVGASTVGGQTPIMATPNGATNRAMAISMATAVSNTDQSATAFAGSGRVNGTVVAAANGGGAVISAEINVSALTLGTAASVLAVLQESRGGTNFEDIWTSDPITTTGIVSTPAITVAGRRRWCFHSVGGTSTTVTATITTLELFGNYPLLRQFRDAYAATNPFATVFNSATLAASSFVLTTLNSATTPFLIEGLKALTFHIDLTGAPTVTTQPVIVAEFSKNGTTWWTSAVTLTAAGNGLYTADVQNKAFRFARLKVQTAAAYSSGSYTISNIGMDGLA